MASLAGEFTKGLWKELPPFRLVLGLCPVLAVTKSLVNGLRHGARHGIRAGVLQHHRVPSQERDP